MEMKGVMPLPPLIMTRVSNWRKEVEAGPYGPSRETWRWSVMADDEEEERVW